jgi:hypothetical protein
MARAASPLVGDAVRALSLWSFVGIWLAARLGFPSPIANVSENPVK